MDFEIKKVKFYPSDNRIWDQGVYLGLSLNNRIYSNEKWLSVLLDYIGNKTNKISILIGDYLHRYNEQIFSGLTEEEAINESLKKSNTLKIIFEKTINKCKSDIDYDFISSSKFINHSSFKIKFQKFQSLYQSSLPFRNLMDYTIDVFLKRQTKIKVDLKEARHLCLMYLIEEIVIFEILAEDGYRVNIYPGNQLPIIKAICTGELKNISLPLEQIQAVEVKFRPKYNSN